MGTPTFAVPVLEKLLQMNLDLVLVVTQPDRPVGRKRVLTPPPVKRVAVENNIPVYQPEKLVDNYQEILAYEPDIIITAAYGQLLPKALLDYPEYGCINVHASLLPALRGGAPIHYAILEGKEETGVTIMYMVEKLDAGDIISQRKVAIAKHDNVGTLHDKLADVGAELLTETLPKIFAKDISPIKQDESQVTYAPNITPEQEKIDWNKSHVEVFNQIRGLCPWPGAYTTYQGKRMKIWESEKDPTTYEGTPGEIIDIIDETSFVVICGDQKGVRIKTIQPAGSRKMTVSEYLRGAKDRIQKGIILGEEQ